MKISRARTGRGDPEVTAVIPCYNYGHYLPEAVGSVLGQAGVRARVIIVDDCSTDGSLQVAERLAREDPRVSVIAHAVNAGHIRTYNDGFAAVETRYVTLVSADDLVAPGALGRATTLMEANVGVGMVYGQPIEFSDAPPTTDRDGRAPLTWTVWRGHEWIRLASIRGRCFILSPEVVMRTDAVREIGGYNVDLPKSGDLEYWLRTASRWDVGRVNGRVQAYYRQHARNMHAVTLPSMTADIRHRLLSFAYLVGDEFAHVSDQGDLFYGKARNALAREATVLAIRGLDAGGHPTVARELRNVAIEIKPSASTSWLMQRLDSRLRRAEAGAAPSAAQRSVEFSRSQLDRIRWRFWVHTGVS
ncbi:MAG TPA: glycosyltransferase family 2 protein [Glaciibacter sp.]|nr:glycosyltransferase family 2 protein [Glaciibacter sp.]